MKNIAVFASGGGTNAENLIRNLKQGLVRIVLCNNPNAYVLKRAQQLNIPTHVFSKEDLRDKEFLQILKPYDIDLILLAGFLLKVPSYLLEAFPQRIINIHPALLPAYGGKGMYGEHVHQAVIAAGECRSGITIHLADSQYDHGTHLFQATCEITPEDTPDSLAAKIHILEQKHFPEVVDHYIINFLNN